jgi:phosphopantothenoylcysteine decarboxylase/phosphopantothenate--cysteine ligase
MGAANVARRSTTSRVTSAGFTPRRRESPMRILITAGPTREYVDDVRYLSNASSGRMGYAIAEAALAAGHEVVLVSGPVELPVPKECEFHAVETTSEMKDACLAAFAHCDGVIAAAAVCDYKPRNRVSGKISKTGEPITIEMIETDDVLAELGRIKNGRWVVGFALEAENPRENALQKLRAKNCDFVILNAPGAIGSERNDVELIGPDGRPVHHWQGTKHDVAAALVAWIGREF